MSEANLSIEPKIIEVQQYSNNTDSVTFLFDRYTNSNIDLSVFKSKIVLDSKNIIMSGIDNTLIQEHNKTKVKITWNFDSIVTARPGRYSFQIIFVDQQDTVKMYTDIGKLKVNSSLNVENVIFLENLSLFQQWENRIESLVSGGYYIPQVNGNIISWTPSNSSLPQVDSAKLNYEIVNNLMSESGTASLSANQGRVLKSLHDGLVETIEDLNKKTIYELADGLTVEIINQLVMIYLNGYEVGSVENLNINMLPVTQIYAPVSIEGYGLGFIKIDTSGIITLYDGALNANITGKIYGTLSYFRNL